MCDFPNVKGWLLHNIMWNTINFRCMSIRTSISGVQPGAANPQSVQRLLYWFISHTQAMPHSAASAKSLHLFPLSFPLCNWEKDIKLQMKLSEPTPRQNSHYYSHMPHCSEHYATSVWEMDMFCLTPRWMFSDASICLVISLPKKYMFSLTV